MLLSKNFNFAIFFIATFLIGLLTIITFLFAAAADEGTGGVSTISLIMAKLFYILRFPTHTILWETFSNGSGFFSGLLINCLLYGFLIERIVAFIKLNTTKAKA